MRVWVSLLLLASLVVQVGCGRERHKEHSELVASNETVDRQVVISLKGDDQAEFTGKAQLRFELPGKDDPLQLLVVATPGYLDVGSGVSLSIGIVLTGQYKGDGKYVLQPHVGPGGSPAQNPADTSNNSRVTFYARNTSTPEETFRAYDSLGAPCQIDLRDDARVGKVVCPVIVSVEKTRVSFTMGWGPV